MALLDLIETAPHEFRAQFNFDDGLAPYFAADRQVKRGGGSLEGHFSAFEETWKVKLYYQTSNIRPPSGGTTPAGTEFRLDEPREFRLAVEADEPDRAGQKSFNAHIRPRWTRMKVEDNHGGVSTLNVPFEEGVNVKIDGSNIEFEHYPDLLREAAAAVGINTDHFADDRRHKSSTVQQAERYIRVHEDDSGPVHARDGPLARAGHLLEDDRDGRREIEQADVSEDGEKVPGYRHQVALDERRVQEVWPNHNLPKRFKHYRPRETNVSGPIKHPKVGAIYYGSLWRDRRESHGVTAEEIEQLNRELEEAVLSILHDAGLDVTSTSPFVSDDYFTAETTPRERAVVELPLQQLRSDQTSVVINQVADGLSPVQWGALETLVTDGGQVSPQEIADEGGFHRDSVYRALDEMDELVEREYGSVSVASTHVAELVHTAVREAKERTREAVEAGAKALEAAERGLDERTSAFVAFAASHFENYRERDQGLEIDFGTLEADRAEEARREIRLRLRQARDLWDDMNRDTMTWKMGRWRARIRHQTHPETNYLNQTTTTVEGGPLHKI